MLTFDATTKSLEAVLSAVVTTTQPVFFVTYVDLTTSSFTPIEFHGPFTNTTPVTIVAAPAGSTQRQVKFLSVYNKDSKNITVTFSINVSTVLTTICAISLRPSESLEYSDGRGFQVRDSSGFVKTNDTNIPGGISAIAGGTITSGSFQNLQNISFGISGQTLTASKTRLLMLEPNHYDLNANAALGSSNALNLSLQGLIVSAPINITQIDLIAHYTVANSTQQTTWMSVGIYSLNISTLGLASSYGFTLSHLSGSGLSGQDGYSSYSGTQWRSHTMTTPWLVVVSNYYMAFLVSLPGIAGTTASMTIYGQFSVSMATNIVNAAASASATSLNYWAPWGMYAFTGNTALGAASLPPTIQLSEFSPFHTASPRQPYFRLLGQ